MTSTLTQISNVFNLLAQGDPRINFYHFGWRFDINRGVINNFDPDNLTGKLFPAVQFDVPDFVEYLEQPDILGTKQRTQIQLYFDALQDYDNVGDLVNINLIEQWTDLKQIAEDFLINFKLLFEDTYQMGFMDLPKFVPRSNMHNDRLLTWEVTFLLTHQAPCTDPIYIIDPNDYPLLVKKHDLERKA